MRTTFHGNRDREIHHAQKRLGEAYEHAYGEVTSELRTLRGRLEERDETIAALREEAFELRLAIERTKVLARVRVEHDLAMLDLAAELVELGAEARDPHTHLESLDEAGRIEWLAARTERMMQDPRGRFPADVYAVSDAAHARHPRRHRIARRRDLARFLAEDLGARYDGAELG